MNSMTQIIEGVKQSSRLFNDEPQPKPTSVIRDLSDAIEIANTLSLEMRRLEHRLVLIQAKLEGLQTIQRP